MRAKPIRDLGRDEDPGPYATQTTAEAQEAEKALFEHRRLAGRRQDSSS